MFVPETGDPETRGTVRVEIEKQGVNIIDAAARGAGDDPVTVLRRQIRADAGHSRRMSPTLVAALEVQYRQHPSWSVRLHYDNLRAALGAAELPSYATVRRCFAARGLRRLRRSVEVAKHFAPREVRSFEVEHTNALWHLDFHECSRNVVTAQGQWVKPVALCVLDDRSRLVCHGQWYWDQTTRSLVHGFSQALMRRALPRALMTDNGAAMMADEFRNGLHALGILTSRHCRTRRGSTVNKSGFGLPSKGA